MPLVDISPVSGSQVWQKLIIISLEEEDHIAISISYIEYCSFAKALPHPTWCTCHGPLPHLPYRFAVLHALRFLHLPTTLFAALLHLSFFSPTSFSPTFIPFTPASQSSQPSTTQANTVIFSRRSCHNRCVFGNNTRRPIIMTTQRIKPAVTSNATSTSNVTSTVTYQQSLELMKTMVLVSVSTSPLAPSAKSY